MSYEVFEKTVRRDTEPRVTISTLGRIQFNASAARKLQEEGVDAVLLLWDKDTRKIAMKKTSKKDDRSYVLRYAKKGNGAGFASKTFLEWCRYDYSQTKSYPCKWVESESMYEFSVDAVTQPVENTEPVHRFPRSQGRRLKGETEEKRQTGASV